jgi:hypothetical protein
MTCRKCLKKGQIATFCGASKKEADTNVQDGQDTREEAEQQLLDGSGLVSENEDYYADLFLCEMTKITGVCPSNSKTVLMVDGSRSIGSLSTANLQLMHIPTLTSC